MTGLQPHRGTVILTLGIVSLVVCPFLGLAPWLMGNTDLSAIEQGRMDPEGRGLTQAGRICGMVATGLAALTLLMFAGYVVLLFVFMARQG